MRYVYLPTEEGGEGDAFDALFFFLKHTPLQKRWTGSASDTVSQGRCLLSVTHMQGLELRPACAPQHVPSTMRKERCSRREQGIEGVRKPTQKKTSVPISLAILFSAIAVPRCHVEAGWSCFSCASTNKSLIRPKLRRFRARNTPLRRTEMWQDVFTCRHLGTHQDVSDWCSISPEHHSLFQRSVVIPKTKSVLCRSLSRATDKVIPCKWRVRDTARRQDRLEIEFGDAIPRGCSFPHHTTQNISQDKAESCNS